MKVSKLIHDLHEQVDELKIDNKNAHLYIDDLKKENMDLRKNQDYVGLNRQITDLKTELTKFRKENVRLVAQLENDEHNVGHLDEKMKRLNYLEKVFASNRYVFTDIPNTPENLKMVKMMKKYVNKR